MKICAIICEFNPFHNGHKYLLDKARELSGCDAVLCIMSGDFTQRGEMCVSDKYTRAKHAVLGGADCVIQLPAAFAVAPAEIFAKGAVKILSSIPAVTAIAFGCESGNADAFYAAADLLIDESGKFKKRLTENLADGQSYAKSYAGAFKFCGGGEDLISGPNNVLALEYVKAIRRAGAGFEILPVRRIGAGYKDGKLHGNFSSASAIRKNIGFENVKNNVPDFVYADLKNAAQTADFESFLRNCLFKTDAENLKRVYGCTEGLENKLKSLENLAPDKIVAGATSRRYSSSRIQRILCANALELYGADADEFLNGDLYIKTLAVKKQRANELLAELAKSAYPLIAGANNVLGGAAHKCFEKDKYEFGVYKFLTGCNNKDYMVLVQAL